MCTCFFFFNDTATTEIYTLSLHDALPISKQGDPHIACEVQSAKPWIGMFNRAIAKQIVVSGFFRCLFEHPGFRSNDDAHIFEIHPVRAVSIGGQIQPFNVDVPEPQSIYRWTKSLTDEDARKKATYDPPTDTVTFTGTGIMDKN